MELNPGPSGVGSNRAANCVTTTAHSFQISSGWEASGTIEARVSTRTFILEVVSLYPATPTW